MNRNNKKGEGLQTVLFFYVYYGIILTANFFFFNINVVLNLWAFCFGLVCFFLLLLFCSTVRY